MSIYMDLKPNFCNCQVTDKRPSLPPLIPTANTFEDFEFQILVEIVLVSALLPCARSSRLMIWILRKHEGNSKHPS